MFLWVIIRLISIYFPDVGFEEDYPGRMTRQNFAVDKRGGLYLEVCIDH